MKKSAQYDHVDPIEEWDCGSYEGWTASGIRQLRPGRSISRDGARAAKPSIR